MASINELVDKLLVLTASGKIDWRGSPNGKVMIAGFGDYTTVISYFPGTVPIPDLEFRVLGKGGDEIEKVGVWPSQQDEFRGSLLQLHDAANRYLTDKRRSAQNHTLDDVMAEIEKTTATA